MGPRGERIRTSPANWGKPKTWNKAHAKFFAQHGRRQRVFCASLADVFDNEVDWAWRRDLSDLIELTPNLDWLLLTKRIGNVIRMLPTHDWAARPNVWLGITVVNQEEADHDIPKLLALKAHRRFLSMEPLLGPVDLNVIDINGHGEIYPLRGTSDCEDDDGNPVSDLPGIDWVIAGGESGPGARPMHPDWARSLRDQSQAAGTPFTFKQWGQWTPGENVPPSIMGIWKNATWFNNEWLFGDTKMSDPEDGWMDEPDLYRVGNGAAGRLLDGVQHDGFPGGAS